MTADIVNLRKARKAKERAAKEATAAANRVTFGKPKAMRDTEKAASRLTERRHEGHRLAKSDARPSPEDE